MLSFATITADNILTLLRKPVVIWLLFAVVFAHLLTTANVREIDGEWRLHKGDYGVYYLASHLAAEGKSPYVNFRDYRDSLRNVDFKVRKERLVTDVADASEPPKPVRLVVSSSGAYQYPPYTAIAMSLLYSLPPVWVEWLWWVAIALATLVSVWLTAKIVGGDDRLYLALGWISMVPSIFAAAVSLGQIAPLVLLLITIGLYALYRFPSPSGDIVASKPTSSHIVVALSWMAAAMFKLVSIPLLCWLLWRGHWRTVLGALVFLVAVTLMTLLVVDWSIYAEYFELAFSNSPEMAHSFLVPFSFDHAWWWVLSALILVVTVACCWRPLRQYSRHISMLECALVISAVLLLPINDLSKHGYIFLLFPLLVIVKDLVEYRRFSFAILLPPVWTLSVYFMSHIRDDCSHHLVGFLCCLMWLYLAITIVRAKWVPHFNVAVARLKTMLALATIIVSNICAFLRKPAVIWLLFAVVFAHLLLTTTNVREIDGEWRLEKADYGVYYLAGHLAAEGKSPYVNFRDYRDSLLNVDFKVRKERLVANVADASEPPKPVRLVVLSAGKDYDVYQYPPYTAIAMSLLYSLPPVWVEWLWWATLVLATLVSVWLTAKTVGGDDRLYLALGWISMTPAVFANAVYLGQIGPLVLLLITIGLYALYRFPPPPRDIVASKSTSSSVVVAFSWMAAAMLKLVSIPLLCWLLWRGHWRTVLGALVFLVAVTLLTLLVVDWSIYAEYFELAFSNSPEMAHSFLGVPFSFDHALDWVLSAMVLAVTVVCCWGPLRQYPQHISMLECSLIISAVLLMPINEVHFYSYMLLLFPLLVIVKDLIEYHRFSFATLLPLIWTLSVYWARERWSYSYYTWFAGFFCFLMWLYLAIAIVREKRALHLDATATRLKTLKHSG